LKPRLPFWRRWLLPAFLTLLVLNVMVATLWTVPRSLRLRNATARVAAAHDMLERERVRAARQRERAEAIEANGADLKRFYESIVGPERTELLPTLEAIEDMARAPGLQPGARNFRREEVDDARVERVAVTLPLTGSYEQLVGFLREVEGSERFLTVDAISLRGQRQGGAALQVEMSAFMHTGPDEAGGGSP
jgi:Tfp pilus assembly protein PilO